MSSAQSSTDTSPISETPEEFLQIRARLTGTQAAQSIQTETLRRIEGWSFNNVDGQTLLVTYEEHLDRQILLDRRSENLTNSPNDITPGFLGDELRFHLKGMITDLLPYQLLGVCLMLKGSRGHSFGFNGGILADKMALGKTVQIIGEVVNSLRFSEQCMIVNMISILPRYPLCGMYNVESARGMSGQGRQC